MSEFHSAAADSAQFSNVGQPASNLEPVRKLRGRMGVAEVVLTVLAFSAPLTVAWGYLPFVIVFAGLGAPVSFLVAGIILLFFSVGYVKLSQVSPNPGAFYALIAVGINKLAGLGSAFLAAFGYLLIGSGVYAFFGIVARDFIVGLGGPTVTWYWLSLLLFVIVGAFGYVGIEFSAKTLAVLLAIEVVVVTIFDVAVFSQGGANGLTLEPLSWHAFAGGNVGLGVLYAVVMFIGFEATAVFREEAKDPLKTIPRATYLSVIFIAVFYSFAAWMLITAVGTDKAVDLAGSDPAGLFPNAFGEFVGATMKDIVTVFVMTSVAASALAIHNVFARYLFSLGVDGALPKLLGRVHPKQASPYIASLVGTATGLVVVTAVFVYGLDPGIFYGRVAGIASLCIIILMLLTTVAVFVFFRRAASMGQNVSAWSGIIAPVLSMLGLGAIIVLALANANAFMAATTTLSVIFIIGIMVVFVAGVVTARYLRNKRPDTYARLGRQTE
jgi:amino acid transporter